MQTIPLMGRRGAEGELTTKNAKRHKRENREEGDSELWALNYYEVILCHGCKQSCGWGEKRGNSLVCVAGKAENSGKLLV